MKQFLRYAIKHVMQPRPYLLIVDDTLIAQCLQRLLESEFSSVGIVTNAEMLVASVTDLKPDVILLDTSMRGLNGFDAMRRLREVSPTAKLMVVTMHDEPEYVAEALRAGASGYVLKWCPVSELVTAIRSVLNGRSYLTPSLGERVTSLVRKKSDNLNSKSLTLRQREVLHLVADGRTAKEIAYVLGVSVKTAVFHKMSIMDKLGLRTTAELTRYALEHGILSTTQKLEPSLPANRPLASSTTSA